MALWLCSYVAIWLCGYVAMQLCGYVASQAQKVGYTHVHFSNILILIFPKIIFFQDAPMSFLMFLRHSGTIIVNKSFYGFGNPEIMDFLKFCCLNDKIRDFIRPLWSRTNTYSY